MVQPWILYALGSGLAFASMAMAYKKAFSYGTSSFTVNLFAFGIGFLIILGIGLLKEGVKIPDTKVLVWIALGAILLLFGNYLYVTAIGIAPNPGFATALKTTDILFATFLGWLIFRGELSIIQIFGVIMIIGGVFLVAKK